MSGNNSSCPSGLSGGLDEGKLPSAWPVKSTNKLVDAASGNRDSWGNCGVISRI